MKKTILVLGILSWGLMSFSTSDISVENNTHKVMQEEIVIEGVGVTKTIETTGKETIRIEGTNNKITISGSCNAIKIEGVDNIVTVDDVKTVNIEGTGNKVTYKEKSESDVKVQSKIRCCNENF